MARAVYSVEVAWERMASGLFQIGRSKIGSPDRIGADFGVYDFDDVPEFQTIKISRGRSSDFAAMDAGSCTVTLHDPDGRYNPRNSSSPLYNYLLPMRQLRVRAVFGGVTYTLFHGFITDIESNPDVAVRQATITCTDLFAWLRRSRPIVPLKSNYTTGQLFGVILDAARWYGAAWRDLSAGGKVVPEFKLDGTVDLLTVSEDLLNVDGGLFFIAGNGKATYHTADERYRVGIAPVTLDGDLIGTPRPKVSLTGIINGQTVTRVGGTPQTHIDDVSRSLYGLSDGPIIESGYLESDTQALSLARFIVALSKRPRAPVTRVGLINASDERLTQILTRELGDFVTVSEDWSGTSVAGTIESIEHTISDSGTVHEALYTVRERQMQYFTIGRSKIGGTDRIGY